MAKLFRMRIKSMPVLFDAKLAKKAFKQRGRKAIEDLMDLTFDTMRQESEKVRDTGGLRASWRKSDIKVTQRTIRGSVFSNNVAAPVLEAGARAHTPPQGALAGWISRKFSGRSPSELRRIEFNLRRKIGREGFKPKRIFESSLIRIKPRIQKILNKNVVDLTIDLSRKAPSRGGR